MDENALVTSTVLLGTVAIEPSRWDRRQDRAAPIRAAAWLDTIAVAGFDGLEVWERHLTEASAEDVAAMSAHRLPVTVFNTYVSLDDPDPVGRTTVSDWVRRSGATGVKFNVGADPAAEGDYAARIHAWLEDLPDGTSLLCECHQRISIAEDPSVAGRIFDRVGAPDQLGAIVHTHDSDEHLRACFDVYGDRIRHVHVNHLRFTDGLTAPGLDEIRDHVAGKVGLLRSLGFDGTWTIEFVRGVSTSDDRPEVTVAQAASDLAVLRSLL